MSKPQAVAVAPNQARRRLLVAGLGFATGVIATRRAFGGTQASQRPIEVGLLPYLPTARLLASHEPLRLFFEQKFKRPVVLSTAPDFKRFQQRVLAGDFDVYLIGPGPGWQAHVDREHEVLAVSKRPLRIMIVAGHDGPVRSVGDLRGCSVAVIDPLTVTSQTTVAMLRQSGLEPGRDVRVKFEKIPFNAVQAVALGELEAAGVPDLIYPSFPADLRKKLKVVARSEELPGVLFMAGSSPDAPQAREFQSALLSFAESDAGRTFVRELNHDGLAKPNMDSLRFLDRFVPETRRVVLEP
jgi:phosphonate transport system substrate-binding protein